MSMYARTGVQKPGINESHLTRMASAYSDLATNMSAVFSSTTQATMTVTSNNSGVAVNAFTGQMSEITSHVGNLATAAVATSQAYAISASSGSAAVSSMDAIADHGESLWKQAILKRAPLPYFFNLVIEVRNALTAIESQAVSSISSAFSAITLPEYLTVSGGEQLGHLDYGIAEGWAALSDDEKMAVLQTMADEFAKEHGLEPLEITFEPIVNPRGVTYGSYSPSKNVLRINTDVLDQPRILTTAIHEMEHYRQHSGMRATEYPYAGMTKEEAHRWTGMNETYVRERGGSESYRARPVEVGAREAGREWINDMSYAEYQQYKEQALGEPSTDD